MLKSAYFGVRLDVDTATALSRMARLERESRGYIIRRLIREAARQRGLLPDPKPKRIAKASVGEAPREAH